MKQGGVLSPILFGLYLDRLIAALRQSGCGCYVGPHFAGCLAYADDVVLMAPTKTGLQQMIDICVQFSLEYKLKFNGSKSQYIIFEPKTSPDNDSIHAFDGVLRNQSSVNHLGHKIYAATGMNDLDGVIAAFYRQFNYFRAKFGNVASSIQASLFETYCSSFYGLVLQPLHLVHKLQVVWRKSQRIVWKLPYRTHCSILRCLSRGLCDRHIFLSRFSLFATNALNHRIDAISFIMNTALHACLSPFRKNVQYCCGQLQMGNELLRQDAAAIRTGIRKQCNELCKVEADQVKALTIFELSDTIDQLKYCILDPDEINFILNDIAVN